MGKRVVKFRGLAEALQRDVLEAHPGQVVDGERAAAMLKAQDPERWRGLTFRHATAGLRFLADSARAHKVRYGHYQAINGCAPAPDPKARKLSEVEALDLLLDAMAQAEPVLRRARKVLTILEDVK